MSATPLGELEPRNACPNIRRLARARAPAEARRQIRRSSRDRSAEDVQGFHRDRSPGLPPPRALLRRHRRRHETARSPADAARSRQRARRPRGPARSHPPRKSVRPFACRRSPVAARSRVNRRGHRSRPRLRPSSTAAPVEARGGGHGRHVRSCVWSATERRDPLDPSRPASIRACKCVAAVQGDRAAAEALHGEATARPGPAPVHFLRPGSRPARIEALGTAVRRGTALASEPAPEPAHEIVQTPIDVAGRRSRTGCCRRRHRSANAPAPVCDRRRTASPGGRAVHRHQLTFEPWLASPRTP